MNTSFRVPIWFWILSLLAITWNAIGVVAYLGESYMTAEQFAKLDPAIQDAYNNRPSFIVAAFAIAVFSGLAGSIFLLLRKKLAVPLLVLSFIAVCTQHVYSFGIAKMHTIVSTFNVVMAIVVFLIAFALMIFAVSRKKLGWLK